MNYDYKPVENALGKGEIITRGTEVFERYEADNGLVARISPREGSIMHPDPFHVSIIKSEMTSSNADYNLFHDITEKRNIFGHTIPNDSGDYLRYLVDGYENKQFRINSNETEFSENIEKLMTPKKSFSINFESIMAPIIGMAIGLETTIYLIDNSTPLVDGIGAISGLIGGYVGLQIFSKLYGQKSRNVIDTIRTNSDVLEGGIEKGIQLLHSKYVALLQREAVEVADLKRLGKPEEALSLQKSLIGDIKSIEKCMDLYIDALRDLTSQLDKYAGMSFLGFVPERKVAIHYLNTIFDSVPNNKPIIDIGSQTSDLPKSQLPKPSKVNIPTVEEMKKGAKPSRKDLGWLG